IKIIKEKEKINKLILIPVEYNGQRVLTTAQLAEAYGTTFDTINYREIFPYFFNKNFLDRKS
ncbi:MAG: ORF6N domain-containing protein, partial [Ruminococcus sp.]|nr:ORF6N domain-containing protein [Ruminococcus sp.]